MAKSTDTCVANTNTWRATTANMKIVYHTEPTEAGAPWSGTHPGTEDAGHKDRFDKLLRRAAKEKR